MGAKRLKAIAVRGTHKLKMEDPGQFDALRKKTFAHVTDLDQIPYLKGLSLFGTCAGIVRNVSTGKAPIRNWSKVGGEAFPGYEKIGHDQILKYQLRKSGCGNCPINCGGIVAVKEGCTPPRDVSRNTRPSQPLVPCS